MCTKHPYIRAVFTARIYGCIFDTRTYGPYIPAVCTGSAYRSPVYTAHIYTACIKKALFAMLFVCTARIYGPHVPVSKMHPYIRAVNTDRIYGRSVHTTRIYVPYSQKALRTMLFFVQAVYTGDRYALPVHMARMYRPYVRVSKMHPYIWAVNTAGIYGCLVHTTCIDRPYS